MRDGQMLILWSAPRSRSTAFFRMMIERGDFAVVHEPFSYLAEFGQVDLNGERVTNAAELRAALRSLARSHRVFVKETTGKRYPEVLCDPEFVAKDAVHTFLIRHPRETIASRYGLDPHAAVGKIGFESQYEIYAEVCRLTDTAPAVIDAQDLMADPAAIVKVYCKKVGIDFIPESLAWQPADRHEWQLSKRWHADVAASTGFSSTAGGNLDIDQHPILSGYLTHHLPFYEKLHAQRLTI